MTKEELDTLVNAYIIEQAKAGKTVFAHEAMHRVVARVHGGFIRAEIYNRTGAEPPGFLAANGMRKVDSDGTPVKDKRGRYVPDPSMLGIMNRYLNADNRLDTEHNRPIREALVKAGVPIDQSPTYPV